MYVGVYCLLFVLFFRSQIKRKVPWKWQPAQEKAFKEAKALLKSDKVLVHYDREKELILSCDASPFGVGAVLAHKMEDGSERPIGYASRTLTPAEQRYAQIDREALAIVYGVKRFHQHLYGRKFVIHTDHKPLIYLFNESKLIPPMASSRVQRWALTLSGYQYVIRHKQGSEQGNVDGLSRLPQPTTLRETPQPGDTILLMKRMNSSLVTAAQVRSWTERDPTLAKVWKYTLQGWPQTMDDKLLMPYFQRREELSVEDNCVLWGT